MINKYTGIDTHTYKRARTHIHLRTNVKPVFFLTRKNTTKKLNIILNCVTSNSIDLQQSANKHHLMASPEFFFL